jgi:hypothetical protein
VDKFKQAGRLIPLADPVLKTQKNATTALRYDQIGFLSKEFFVKKARRRRPGLRFDISSETLRVLGRKISWTETGHGS